MSIILKLFKDLFSINKYPIINFLKPFVSKSKKKILILWKEIKEYTKKQYRRIVKILKAIINNTIEFYIILLEKFLKLLTFLERKKHIIFCFILYTFVIYFYTNDPLLKNLKSIHFALDSKSVLEFMPSVFLTLGAAVFGVIAIVFSLNLFAVQQAADKYTPVVFERFSKNIKASIIFWLIVTISLWLLASAFIVTIGFFGIKILYVNSIFVVFLFILLSSYHKDVIKIVNPLEVIEYYKKEAISLLDKAHKIILKKTKKIKNNSDKRKLQSNYWRDVQNNTNIFLAIKLFHLEQIYALIPRSIQYKEYITFRKALNSICDIANHYFKIRSGTFFQVPALLSTVVDSQDVFLGGINGLYEKFDSINTQAIKYKDVEVAQDVLKAYERITSDGIKVEQLVMQEWLPKEHKIVNYAIGYMGKSIDAALAAGMFDIGMRGAEALGRIAKITLDEGYEFETTMSFKPLRRITLFYYIFPIHSVLLSYPLKSYLSIFDYVITHKTEQKEGLIREIVDEVQSITLEYIKKEKNSAVAQIEDTLGDCFSPFMHPSFPTIIQRISNIIQNENNQEKRKELVYLLNFINERIRYFFIDIAQEAGKNDSAMIHQICSGVSHINKILISLYEKDLLDENNQKKLLENITWYASSYWRYYEALNKISRRTAHYDVNDDLFSLGLKLIKIEQDKEFERVLQIMLDISENLLDKSDSSNFALRYLKNALVLCINRNNDKISTKFINNIIEDRDTIIFGIKKSFLKRFAKKHPLEKQNLLNILNSFKTKDNDALSKYDLVGKNEELNKFIEKIKQAFNSNFPKQEKQ